MTTATATSAARCTGARPAMLARAVVRSGLAVSAQHACRDHSCAVWARVALLDQNLKTFWHVSVEGNLQFRSGTLGNRAKPKVSLYCIKPDGSFEVCSLRYCACQCCVTTTYMLVATGFSPSVSVLHAIAGCCECVCGPTMLYRYMSMAALHGVCG